MSEKKSLSIKLVVDKQNNRFLFAECDKDFVDVLFSFLTLPMGTIIRLLNKQSKLGCMDALYQTVEALDKKNFQTEACKEMLLKPRSASESEIKCQHLAVNLKGIDSKVYYYFCPDWICSTEIHCLASTFGNTECLCGQVMSSEHHFVNHHYDDGVFVKGTGNFIVTEDLQVTFGSIGTCLKLFDQLGIKDVSSIQESIVTVDEEMVTSLLKCLLLSKTPMTEAFLCKKDLKRSKSELLDTTVQPLQKLSVTKKMEVRLFLSKSKNKVLYAEAKEDFLDLLFGFLTFPLGSLVNLFGGHDSLIGSIGVLYKSFEDLYKIDSTKFKEINDKILDIRTASHYGGQNHLINIREDSNRKRFRMRCSCQKLVCNHVKKSVNVHFINPKVTDTSSDKGGGFVKGPLEFMITDDLAVTPLSPLSGIFFINKVGIPFKDIEERVIQVGQQEALSVLEASLTSETVLTDAFCRSARKQTRI